MGFKRYVALPVVLTMMAAGAVPAQAAVFDKGNFTFEDSFTEDMCGLEVRHDFTVRGHFRSRTGKGDLDQAFFGMSVERFTDTFTNLANGKRFSFFIDGKNTAHADTQAYSRPDGAPLLIGVGRRTGNPADMAQLIDPVRSNVQEVVLHNKPLSSLELLNHVSINKAS